MHFDKGRTALDQWAIAHGADLRADRFYIQVVAPHKKLHVKAVADRWQVEWINTYRSKLWFIQQRLSGELNCLAAQPAQHPFQNIEEALAARIDDAGSSQNRQQGWRFLYRFASRLEHVGHHKIEVLRYCRGAHRVVGGLPDNCQDRALHRLDNTLVGGFTACPQAGSQVTRADAGLVAETVRHAAQDLREDDAGVAAGAHQRTLCHGLRHATDVRFAAVFDLCPGRAHGQHHIDAGVAIRNRKHVQCVDDVAVALQPAVAGLNQNLEVLTIDLWNCMCDGCCALARDRSFWGCYTTTGQMLPRGRLG